MLRKDELTRYERQINIPGWGEAGQLKLRGARIVVAGAGGLGSVILLYLTAAGVGHIRVVDSDKVELSNLNRQVLHMVSDIGKLKAESAKEKLESLNPEIEVEAIAERITEENVFDLVDECPIVDAMDNLTTRYLLNKVAVLKGIPIFHGAVYGFEGRVTTIIPGQTPCLKCMYREVLPGKIPVAGVTPAVVGSIQATEVIKYVMKVGDLLTNRLLVYDGMKLKFNEVKLKKDPQCEVCR